MARAPGRKVAQIFLDFPAKDIDKPRQHCYNIKAVNAKRCSKTYVPVAQLVEHLTFNQRVQDSSSCGRTKTGGRSYDLPPVFFLFFRRGPPPCGLRHPIYIKKRARHKAAPPLPCTPAARRGFFYSDGFSPAAAARAVIFVIILPI